MPDILLKELKAENARLMEQYNKAVEYNQQAQLKANEIIDALKAQLAAAQLDAARYRWIREDAVGREAAAMSMIDAFCEDDLDAAIDSAMKGEQS